MNPAVWISEVADQVHPGIVRDLPRILPDSIAELWQVIERFCKVSDQQFAQAVAKHFRMSVATNEGLLDAPSKMLSYEHALRLHILPLRFQNEVLHVAVCDPTDQAALDHVRFSSCSAISLEIQSPDWIDNEIVRAYGQSAEREADYAINLTGTDAAEPGTNSVVRLARHLLHLAVKRRASDIHMQPYLGGYLVRMRVDGILIRVSTIALEVGTHVIRHFKAVGKMDITNTIKPHDGRATLYIDNHRYDLRLSTVPNSQGERLVIRLLNQNKVFALERLGYSPARLQSLRRLIRMDSGLIIFVGPTGCGKTTSLYCLMAELNTMDTSIATIEEPVEYAMPGLSQVEVHSKRGVTFDMVLRSQLRQDPDVLLIGEIRDNETAEAAVRAALTGHLVLSTLHCDSARYSVPRLLDLGVAPAVLGETLKAVIAQRLVRRLCIHCSKPATEPFTLVEKLFHEISREFPKLRAVGCENCAYTGYHGMMPVVEVYIPSVDDRKNLLSENPSHDHWSDNTVHNETSDADSKSMTLSLQEMIVSGDTTPEEGARALGNNFWHSLGRHYNQIGWSESPIAEAVLSARNAEEYEVLIISKDQTLLSELTRMLSESRYRVYAADGNEDPHKLLECHPSTGIIVVDIEGDELQATASTLGLRTNFAWSGLPAIALIPPSAPKLAELLGKRLANRMILKPTTAAKIVEVISSISG